MSLAAALAAACTIVSCIAPVSQDVAPQAPMYSWYENHSRTIHIAPDVTDEGMQTALIIHEQTNAAHQATDSNAATCITQDTNSYMVTLAWWHSTHATTWPRIITDSSPTAMAFATQMYNEWTYPDFIVKLVAYGCSSVNGWKS